MNDEYFTLDLQNEDEGFSVDFGETTNLGGGGTDDFNTLKNRPKYAGSDMTGNTNIPSVPTKVSQLTNDLNFAQSSEITSAVSAEATLRENADTELGKAISTEVTNRQNADNGLQGQIDAITASSDVKDIVGTYADLEGYDTSSLGNNDIIKVLQDETHQDETTYYRWSTSTSSFTLIGEEGPYYTKSQTDTLLNAKQGTLTAGTNVSIVNNEISATDTTYSAFTGTDGSSAGSAGLVPAPATTDSGKFLKADGTWAEAGGGGGVTVVQTTGTSQTDVMSQNATTSMICSDPSTVRRIRIGDGATASHNGTIAIGRSAKASYTNAVAVGFSAKAEDNNSVSIGYSAICPGGHQVALGSQAGANTPSSLTNTVALGSYSKATRTGEVNVGTPGYANSGFNNTSYRVIGGVHDGQDSHDAVTVGQVNGVIDAINAALNINISHIGS